MRVGDVVAKSDTGRVVGQCVKLEPSGGIRIAFPQGGEAIYRPYEVTVATDRSPVPLF